MYPYLSIPETGHFPVRKTLGTSLLPSSLMSPGSGKRPDATLPRCRVVQAAERKLETQQTQGNIPGMESQALKLGDARLAQFHDMIWSDMINISQPIEINFNRSEPVEWIGSSQPRYQRPASIDIWKVRWIFHPVGPWLGPPGQGPGPPRPRPLGPPGSSRLPHQRDACDMARKRKCITSQPHKNLSNYVPSGNQDGNGKSL